MGANWPVKTRLCCNATETTSGQEYIVCYIVYDIVRLTYDIVCQNTVLANRMYDIAYDYTTSYAPRTISPKNVRYRTFLTCSCQSYVRHRLRHRMFFTDVAYDIVHFFTHHRYYTISYGRFRCRWSHRLKHTI